MGERWEETGQAVSVERGAGMRSWPRDEADSCSFEEFLVDGVNTAAASLAQRGSGCMEWSCTSTTGRGNRNFYWWALRRECVALQLRLHLASVNKMEPELTREDALATKKRTKRSHGQMEFFDGGDRDARMLGNSFNLEAILVEGV